MKTIKNVVKFLNILVFLYALLGIWLVINWLFIPASKDILYELISRNFLLVLFGIVSVVKITDAIITRVFPEIRAEMYSSKLIYDLGVFYFEFLTIIFLFPISENSIKTSACSVQRPNHMRCSRPSLSIQWCFNAAATCSTGSCGTVASGSFCRNCSWRTWRARVASV